MANPGKFIASIGPYKFYKTPDGSIVDDQGRPAPKRIIDSLAAELNQQDIIEETAEAVEQERVAESVNTPKPKGSKKRKSAGTSRTSRKTKDKPKSIGGILSRNILSSAFPGPYNLYQEYKESQKDKSDAEESDRKRTESELKTEIDYTNVLMKDSSGLIRESISGQQRVTSLLESILSSLNSIRTIIAVKGLLDKFGGGGGRNIPAGKKGGRLASLLKAGLAIGGVAAIAEMLSSSSAFGKGETAPDTTGKSSTPPNDATKLSGSTTTGQTAGVSAAAENTLKQGDVVIDATNILFKSDQLSFETDKLTIDAKNLSKLKANNPNPGGVTPGSSVGGNSPPQAGGGNTAAVAGGTTTPSGTSSRTQGTNTPGGPNAAQVGGQTPSGATVSRGPTQTKPTSQQQKSIVDKIVKWSDSDDMAKVLLGNAMRESGLDPGIHNDNPQTRDDSFGLWQYNRNGGEGANFDRVMPRGSDIRRLDDQLAYMGKRLDEIHVPGTRETLRQYLNNPNHTIDEKNAAFYKNFERGADAAGDIAKSKANIETHFKDISKTSAEIPPAPTGTPPAGGSTGTTSPTPSSPPSTSTTKASLSIPPANPKPVASVGTTGEGSVEDLIRNMNAHVDTSAGAVAGSGRGQSRGGPSINDAAALKAAGANRAPPSPMPRQKKQLPKDSGNESKGQQQDSIKMPRSTVDYSGTGPKDPQRKHIDIITTAYIALRNKEFSSEIGLG